MLDVTITPPPAIIEAQFTKLALGFRSFREPLKRCVQGVVAPSIQFNFDAEGRPEPWAELAEATQIKKARQGSPPDILVETGLLKKVAGQLNLWKITKDEATFQGFPRAQYGELHETGTKYMPKREFLVIQPQDEEEIEQVFVQWILEKIVAADL